MIQIKPVWFFSFSFIFTCPTLKPKCLHRIKENRSENDFFKHKIQYKNKGISVKHDYFFIEKCMG